MTSDIRNPFDAPIPGQSLTDEPGNNRWEHPPQFVNMDEASEYVWELLHEPTKLEQTILLLNSGVSIEALTKGILFSGFVEGKWTPDLAVLLTEVVFNQIMAIGMKGNIKNLRVLIGDHTNTKFKKDLADFTVKKDREKNITKIKEDVETMIVEEQPKMGLMAEGA